MTLLEQIQANTAAVKAGKTALAQAIIDKGTPITDPENPSFSDLVIGVETIETGIPVEGQDVDLYAIEPLQKGDVCELIEPTGEIMMTQTRTTPLTYKEGTSTKNVTNIVLSQYSTDCNTTPQTADGKFIFLAGQYSDYKHPVFPYYLTKTGYQQLKVNNEYAALLDGGSRPLAGFPQAFAYDPVSKKLFAYHTTGSSGDYEYNKGCRIAIYDFDEENLNLTRVKVAGLGGGYYDSKATQFAGFNIYQIVFIQNNLFITGLQSTGSSSNSEACSALTKQYLFNPTDNSVTYIRNITGTTGQVSGSVYNGFATVDFSLAPTGILYVAHTDAYSNSYKVILKKMLKNSSGIFDFASGSYTFSDVKGVSNVPTYVNSRYTHTGSYALGRIPFFMNADCTAVYYISTNGGLRHFVVDNENMTATEQAPRFDDGLDISLVTDVKGTKSQFLYIITSDANYGTSEQLRLYMWDEIYAGWKLFKLPMNDTSINLSKKAVPSNNTYDFINGKETSFFLGTTSTYYRVGKPDLGYDYSAKKANGVLNYVQAYGIAKEDITGSAIGTGLLTIAGHIQDPDVVINEAIGGIY